MLKLSSKNKLYPNQLNRLHKPPNILYISSNAWEDIYNMPMLSVVGSRKPTAYGAAICAQLVREVAAKGVCIVSGLALGTDSIAHSAALEVGGRTIAVLPSGLNKIYPRTHQHLAEDIIAKGGALISEYPPEDSVAQKYNFIARNRIIAGLSSATLIPEAAIKSGSLHTAQFALECGNDILAVPGLITNPQAEGCHNLIKAGAQLVASADDILNYYKLSSSNNRAKIDFEANSPEEHAILSLIANGVTDGEELQLQSGLPVDKFSQTLTMLEITGRISPQGANTWHIN